MSDMVTMSRLPINGRFANQLFQYMFLRVYAKKYNLEYQYPPWPGVDLFDFNDRCGITKILPRYKDWLYVSSMDDVPMLKDVPKNVDLYGTFQYHTSYYSPYKDFIREIFTPKKFLKDQMDEVESIIRSKAKRIIGIHIRKGDYSTRVFFPTDIKWVKESLENFDLSDSILYISSDNPELVLPDFRDYNVYSSLDYSIDCPLWRYRRRRSPFPNQFFADFWMLTRSDVLFISNSSFSFSASMLNTICKEFYRPIFSLGSFVSYDPWNSWPYHRPEMDKKISEERHANS